MVKTLQVAADRAHDDAKTVLPAEVARGVYIKNPPSAEALKLMHRFIATAGGRMAEDVRHELRLTSTKSITGMRNPSHQFWAEVYCGGHHDPVMGRSVGQLLAVALSGHTSAMVQKSRI